MGSVTELVQRFLHTTIPREEWNHRAHLVVGAWHVHHYGVDGAIDRLRVAIRRLNDRHGTPNSATSGYHETVTMAYARLMDQFLAACDPDTSLDECVAHLVAGPFKERDLLLRFWSRDVLMSAAARASWVPPDLRPLVWVE